MAIFTRGLVPGNLWAMMESKEIAFLSGIRTEETEKLRLMERANEIEGKITELLRQEITTAAKEKKILPMSATKQKQILEGQLNAIELKFSQQIKYLLLTQASVFKDLAKEAEKEAKLERGVYTLDRRFFEKWKAY